jgi:hypothetical protein
VKTHTNDGTPTTVERKNPSIPSDLDTQKRTGTSCEIEIIHFSIETTEYLQ